MLVSTEDPTFDWTSMQIHFDGVAYQGMKEIKYDSDLSAAHVYGQGARPIGRTLGIIKPSCSAIMYMFAWSKFLAALGDGFKRKVFNITVKYSLPGEDIITDSILRCRITKVEAGGSNNGDPNEVPLTILPMGILWNGIDEIGAALSNAA